MTVEFQWSLHWLCRSLSVIELCLHQFCQYSNLGSFSITSIFFFLYFTVYIIERCFTSLVRFLPRMDSLLFCPTSSNFLSHWNAIIFPQSPTTEGSFSPTTSGLFLEDSHRQHTAIVLHLSLSYFFLISSSTNWLFRSLLFHFQIFVSFPKFSHYWLFSF